MGRGGGGGGGNQPSSKAHTKPPGRSSKTALPPLDVSMERKKSTNSSLEDDDVESMLKGMRNALRPTPLTAMARTPRGEFEDMAPQRHNPVYAPSFPFNPASNPPNLDPKPTSKP